MHLLTQLVSPDSDFVSVYSETGRAICGGLLTSAVGFGALFLAGLRSMGALANLGFGVNLLVMLVAFPAMLLWLSERRRRKLMKRQALARTEAPTPPPHPSDATPVS